jgi:TPR repeat protein
MNIAQFVTTKILLTDVNIHNYPETDLIEACLEYAEQDNVIAMYNAGLIYANGFKSIPQSLDKAYKWFKKSADLGNKDAIEYINPKANNIYDVDYMIHLGLYYADTHYIEDEQKYSLKDEMKSIHWLRKAVEQDMSGELIFKIAKSFYDGIIVKMNIDKAIYWLSKGADKTNIDCMLLLANIYRYGIGKTPSRTLAAKWLYKCAEQGYIDDSFLEFYKDTKDFTMIDIFIKFNKTKYLKKIFGEHTNLIISLWQANKQKDDQIAILQQKS